MIDITLEGGFVTFTTSVLGAIASQVELCEVVDYNSLHLGTNVGTFLINIEQFTINNIKFTTSAEAVNYILNN
jgi:hypothetical protein